MVDVDSDTLFNGAAAVVATVAVVFFVLNVELGHSPASKLALAVAFLAGVFAITQRTGDGQLRLLGYGVVVTAGVALFFEVVNTFDAGDAVTVVGLLGIAVLLFVLRTRLDEESRFVTGREATYAFGVLVALVAVVVVVDVATGGVAYEFQSAAEIETSGTPHEEFRVGTVVATNPTPLPEPVETPRYAACTAGNWSAHRAPLDDPDRERPREPIRAHLRVEDGYDEHVTSYGTRRYPVTLHVEGGPIEPMAIPIERAASCPETETGPPYLAVYVQPPTEYGRPD